MSSADLRCRKQRIRLPRMSCVWRKDWPKGYVGVRRPNHPMADRWGFVAEHRLVVEAAIGKPLRRSASVHHVDENRANNVGGNLLACDSEAYHKLIHKRLRAMAACGDPSAPRCRGCKSYHPRSDRTSECSTSARQREKRAKQQRDQRWEEYFAVMEAN